MIRAGYFMQEPRVFHSPGLIRDPQVSVILPTFCRGDNGLLERAINSVLSQNFSSFELIVMDDGSTDATADLVSAYSRADDRIIHVRHDTNCGLPALRVNEGLLMARGDLCAYQFDDDRWADSFLASMTGALRDNPGFAVAFARCLCDTADGEQFKWGAPFDYQKLMDGNCIANNSVMHRRSVFEQLGGYDMHLVMRRLCDWDLWVRWGRLTPFLFVDELLSLVEARLPGSIGKTCPVDKLTIRTHMAIDRDASLRPGALQSYVVDELDHLKHLGERKLESVWRQQVATYQCRFRRIWTTVRPPTAKPLHVLVCADRYPSTFEVTIGNFAASLAGDFAFTFVPEAQLDESAIRCADILLLHGTTDDPVVQLAEAARRHGKAVVSLVDEDLFSLHEPGSPGRLALESAIQGADFVLTYSPLLQETVQHLNPRNAVLVPNIQRRWLTKAQPRADGRIRIGFAGGAAPQEEIAVLWPAIVEASRRLGLRAEFYFWGFAPAGLEELQSPYHRQPATVTYDQYLTSLKAAGCDVMIAPLFGDKGTHGPTQFLEIAAAGAVGIYSNVEANLAIVDGVSGIKCENTVEAWQAAILQSATLPASDRQRLLEQAIQTIERDYTSESKAPRVAATLQAAVAHSLLRRADSGKPRIAYFCHTPYLSGAGNRLLGYAALAQAFHFEPVLVLPAGVGIGAEAMQQMAADLGIAVAYLPLTVEMELDVSRQLVHSTAAEIALWLSRNQIGMVHSFHLMREVGEAARSLGIPHVASLYATYTRNPAGILHCDAVHSDALFYADIWSEVLNAPARRIPSFVPERYFKLDDPVRAYGGGRLSIGLFGSVQPRKGQLQAVEAIGLLMKQGTAAVTLQLFGYDHFDPPYLAACKEMAERYGVSDRVTFRGFAVDVASAMSEIDVLLCAGEFEGMPQAILHAMAAGRLVVAPGVGGIPDAISQGTGILMPDNTAASIARALARVFKLTAVEWLDKTRLAREVARQECSANPVAAELFRLYQVAAAGCTPVPKGPETVPEQAIDNGDEVGAQSRLRWLADKSRSVAKLRIFSKA